jgi:hypothetical protein
MDSVLFHLLVEQIGGTVHVLTVKDLRVDIKIK